MCGFMYYRCSFSGFQACFRDRWYTKTCFSCTTGSRRFLQLVFSLIGQPTGMKQRGRSLIQERNIKLYIHLCNTKSIKFCEPENYISGSQNKNYRIERIGTTFSGRGNLPEKCTIFPYHSSNHYTN